MPWFAWVHFYDPHAPYRAPEPYASRHPPNTIELPPREPPGYPGKPDRVRMFAELLGAHTVTDEHLRSVLSIYYASIAMIDDVVGRLLATLDRTGQREHTIVVFTSDHGDFMTEHGLVRKGASLYDSLVRVPLFVSYPGAIQPGTVCDDLVSTIDVYPTLVQLMGLPLLPGRGGQPLPVITGEPPRQMVFAETGYEGTFTNRQQVTHFLAQAVAEGRTVKLPWQLIANTKLKMARTRDWKYVYAAGPDGEDELYNLADDPFELRNLAADPDQAARVAWFRRQLLDWTITSEDALPPHVTPPPPDLAGPE
jgi:arylsulfatase A-like enzyme